MIERIKTYMETTRERIKNKALDIKGSITRQKIMNLLGVYVDEESEEEVEYDNALKEIFYDFLLWLYGYDYEEDEEYVN